MITIVKKITVIFVIFSFVFLQPMIGVYAEETDLSDDSIDSMKDTALDKENIDTAVSLGFETLLELLTISAGPLQGITSGFNTYERKFPYPEVEIMFSPENPRTGEEVTARAFAMNFGGETDDYYYTWYLKRNDGTGTGTDDEGRKTKNGNVDWNEDGEIDIEDYKIQAMRLIAAGSYDSRKADYSDGGDDPDDDGFSKDAGEITEGEAEGECSGNEGDNDCTFAPFGGINNKTPEKGSRCYVKSLKDGLTYEITLEDVQEKKDGCEDPEECSVKVESTCTHLFPNAPDQVTGDGEFTNDEEEFWGTDPENPDTNGDGVPDEESIMGVGMVELTWIYSAGDEVGVAVEGTSITPTKYDDGGYMTMYALPKNNFDVNGTECAIKDKMDYVTPIAGQGTGIYSAHFDIGACLEENFVNPMDGNHPKSLEVDLDYSPEKPKNSTSLVGGDRLVVKAAASNATTTKSDLYYRWTVYQSDKLEINTDNWEEVSDDNGFRGATRIKYLEGNRVDTLEMNLNVFNLKKYLKVVVEVEESYDSEVTRSGSASEIIRVTSSDEEDIIFSSNTSSGEICQAESVCPVLSNQIITANLEDYRNYYWTINGAVISDVDNDGTQQTGEVRFPVIGQPGDTYTVSVVANDTASVDASGSKNEGKKISTTRTLKIVEPSIQITATGGADAKVLGTYTGLDGETVDDESENTLVASSDQVSLQAEFYPSWIEGSTASEGKMKWTVNGEELSEEGNALTLDLSEYPRGSSISVSASTEYSQSSEVRKELRDKWNVSQFSSGDTSMTGSVRIEVPEEFASEQANAGKPLKMMANLLSTLPGQSIFFLRLVLTVAVMTMVFSLAMSLERRRN